MPQRNAFFDAQPARRRVRTNRGALTCQKLPEPDSFEETLRAGLGALAEAVDARRRPIEGSLLKR